MQNMPCKGDKPALLPVILDPAAAAAMKERNKQPGGKAYNEIMDQKLDYEKKKRGTLARKNPNWKLLRRNLRNQKVRTFQMDQSLLSTALSTLTLLKWDSSLIRGLRKSKEEESRII